MQNLTVASNDIMPELSFLSKSGGILHGKGRRNQNGMFYKPLKKYYYADKAEYDKQIQLRTGSFDKYDLPIAIKGFRAKTECKTFIIPTWDIAKKIEMIMLMFHDNMKSWGALPDVAKAMYLMSCIENEVKHTNEIEDISSTKEEIQAGIEATEQNKPATRFSGMIKRYQKLLNPDYEIQLASSNDLRAIYDDVVGAEIDPEDKLDGDVFRQSGVAVKSKMGVTRHMGVWRESNIIQSVDIAIRQMDDARLPSLVNIALFHYFIGYIHPFYDGNGRVNRYITSYLVSRLMHPAVALEMSHMINQNRNIYNDIFDLCNDEKNKGDLTLFVDVFLDFIMFATTNMSRKLEIHIARMIKYNRVISDTQWSEKKAENKKIKQVLYVMVQNALFATVPIKQKELVQLIGSSPTTIKRLLGRCVQNGVALGGATVGRGKVYRMDLAAFERDFLK